MLRIGPPSVSKEHFYMEGKNGKLRRGKRYEIPQYLTSMGQFAYEFSAGRLARFSDNKDYSLFRENVKKHNLFVSLHAPYYISPTSENEEVYNRSIDRIAETYRWATILNASRIVLHPGTYVKGKTFTELKDKIEFAIVEGRKRAFEKYPEFHEAFREIRILPETMGKLGQLGTVDEIIELCKDIGLDKVEPCIDFGHIFARNRGKLKEEEMYKSILKKIGDELGDKILQNLHIHYSRIEYTEKGEKEHVPNTETKWGPNIEPLFELIKAQSLTPVIINESPLLEQDAKILVELWNKISKS